MGKRSSVNAGKHPYQREYEAVHGKTEWIKVNPEIPTLEAGEYYRINKTKKILYWNGEQWMEPVKDQQKRITEYVAKLDKQPKVKSVELITLDKRGDFNFKWPNK